MWGDLKFDGIVVGFELLSGAGVDVSVDATGFGVVGGADIDDDANVDVDVDVDAGADAGALPKSRCVDPCYSMLVGVSVCTALSQ